MVAKFCTFDYESEPFVVEEFPHPVEKYSKHARGRKYIVVLLDESFVTVLTEDLNMIRRLPREEATEIIERFYHFSDMIAGIYFSSDDGTYGDWDCDGSIPLWLGFLHSFGFSETD